MISKAAQGKGLLTHEKQKEAMAQFATFEAGDEGIVEGELWSVWFDSMFKRYQEIWCGTRFVLRFDEFDESDEMLDERRVLEWV
jgi:hypothetical protein